MKSRFDNIVAQMSSDKSADSMVNNFERKGHKQAKKEKKTQQDEKLAAKYVSKTCNNLTTRFEEQLQKYI